MRSFSLFGKLHSINNQDFFNLMEILLDNSRPMSEKKDSAIDYAREIDAIIYNNDPKQ